MPGVKDHEVNISSNGSLNESLLMQFLTDNTIAAAAILTISLPGLLLNVFAVFCFTKHRSFRNSFGNLAALHSAADAGVLCCFVFWAVPMTLAAPVDYLTTANLKVGQFAIFCQTTSFHAILFISLNRLFAIVATHKYPILFSARNTRFIIAWILAVSTAYCAVYFIPSCDFFYSPKSLYWEFANSPCGKRLSTYVDFIGTISLFGVIIITDLITLTRLRSANRRLFEVRSYSDASNTVLNKRRSKEIQFFVQAVIVTVLFVGVFVSFHVLSELTNSRWGTFATTTLAWSIGHAGSGVIVVAFNREIRRLLAHPTQFFALTSQQYSGPHVARVTPPLPQALPPTQPSTQPTLT